MFRYILLGVMVKIVRFFRIRAAILEANINSSRVKLSTGNQDFTQVKSRVQERVE